MALSSDEHNLLVTTCGNMNTAAATCREVLEMLRSLGNTGVVDIATHNNATYVHTADKSIVRQTHVNEDYTSISIQKVTIPDVSSGASTIVRNLQPTTNQEFNYSILPESTVGNGSTTQFLHERRIYLENDSNERISFSSISNPPAFRVIDSNSFIVNDVNNEQSAMALRMILGRFAWHNDGADWWKYNSLCGVFRYGSSSSVITIEFDGGGINPFTNNTLNLGASGHAFKDLYLVNQPSVSSDARMKTDVSTMGNEAFAFVKALRPVGYKLITGEEARTAEDENGQPTVTVGTDIPGERTHWGFIAQEVKQAMTAAGIEDAAVWCLADKDNPNSQQSLRYAEILAPLVKAVQILAAKVEALEGRAA